jgi:hypothetical protein
MFTLIILIFSCYKIKNKIDIWAKICSNCATLISLEKIQGNLYDGELDICMIETRSFCDCYGCLENCNTNGKNDSQ